MSHLSKKQNKLLNQGRVGMQKQYSNGYKRQKTSEDCEVRVGNGNRKIHVPDELKHTYNKVNSSATSDTIRDIFNEILDNIIR